MNVISLASRLPRRLMAIVVTDDDGNVSSFDVHVPGTLVVGRHTDCDLVLPDHGVSRIHARLTFGQETFFVADCSSNGTLLSDKTLLKGTEQEISYGELIRLGPFTLRIGVTRSAPVPKVDAKKERKDDVAVRRAIHVELLKNLDLAKIDANKDDPSLRPRVLTALKRIVKEREAKLPPEVDRDAFIGELLDEAIGLGPLEPLLADPEVTEIMVVDPVTIYVERRGRLEQTTTRFTDEERVRAVVERIVTPLGRRIDESQPLVDARLKDGSRVNAVIRPLALRGTCITIRKFPQKRLTVNDLLALGSVTPRIARFLERCVAAKKNVLISGGTGSGKTTLLNIVSAAIPSGERIVTIEDAAELQLHQPHVVRLETKAANMEGKGAFTIRELVKNALRMRPDRIVVGECRGGEALDMLQAMSTGHDGSLTTIHANSACEALARLETLVLMAGLDLPSRAIRDQISRSIHLVVQIARLDDGSRKLTNVSEVSGLDREGRFVTRSLFELERTGIGPGGKVLCEHQATGYLPSFVDELIARGLLGPGEPWF